MESLTSIGLGEKIVAGCDEAGRGPLAGPVFAAAVILPDGFEHPMVKDSKKLSQKQLQEARQIVLCNATSWAVASCSAQEIDEINILKASILAMQRAVVALYGVGLDGNLATYEERGGIFLKPEHIIIDGNRFYKFADSRGEQIPFSTIVKGDARFSQIAAASILAKTFRDDFMRDLAEKYPQYGWDRNKAYPTKKHREAIAEYGLTPYHRRTFIHTDEGELF